MRSGPVRAERHRALLLKHQGLAPSFQRGLVPWDGDRRCRRRHIVWFDWPQPARRKPRRRNVELRPTALQAGKNAWSRIKRRRTHRPRPIEVEAHIGGKDRARNRVALSARDFKTHGSESRTFPRAVRKPLLKVRLFTHGFRFPHNSPYVWGVPIFEAKVKGKSCDYSPA
jgi:hypothetical protein